MCTSPLLRIWTSDISSFKIKHPGELSLSELSNQDAFVPYEGGVCLTDFERFFRYSHKTQTLYRVVSREKLDFYKYQYGELMHYDDIPCGHCKECRINQSKEWAFRIMHEANKYSHNYFVTLTLNDDHLTSGHYLSPLNGEPLPFSVDKQSGELRSVYTLVKKDLQNFMKRIRINVQRKFGYHDIRFYACGEYGSLNGRPHYHCILMNMPDLSSELMFFGNRDGVITYLSPFVSSSWCDRDGTSKGFITVGEVTFQSAAYVSRYCMKKLNDPDHEFDSNLVQQPCFALMSHRPGIGRDFVFDDPESFLNIDQVYIQTVNKVISCKVPRYYDYLYDHHFAEFDVRKLRLTKARRSLKAELYYADVKRRTNMTDDELREVKRYRLDKSLAKLVRCIE